MIAYTEEEFHNAKGQDHLKLQCEWCETEFTSKKRQIVRRLNKNEEPPKFCSSKCAQNYIHKDKKLEVNCDECGKTFQKFKNQIEKTNSNYCSRSCASSANNRKFPKRQYGGKFCKKCSVKIRKNSITELCLNCNQEEYKNTTLRQLHNRLCVKGKHPSWLNSSVRLHNNSINKNLKNKPCANCGYDKHVELCHIKAVSTFDDDANLGEINHPNNIIQLCRNCHWEFDKGLMMLPARVELASDSL